MDPKHLKKIACEAIDKAAAELNSLSDDIWSHPELCFEEKYSHDALCSFLEKQRFPVERHYVLDTAFRSSVGENEVREHDSKDAQNVEIQEFPLDSTTSFHSSEIVSC